MVNSSVDGDVMMNAHNVNNIQIFCTKMRFNRRCTMYWRRVYTPRETEIVEPHSTHQQQANPNEFNGLKWDDGQFNIRRDVTVYKLRRRRRRRHCTITQDWHKSQYKKAKEQCVMMRRTVLLVSCLPVLVNAVTARRRRCYLSRFAPLRTEKKNN